MSHENNCQPTPLPEIPESPYTLESVHAFHDEIGAVTSKPFHNDVEYIEAVIRAVSKLKLLVLLVFIAMPLFSAAQTSVPVIEGKVVDEMGRPLAGAAVRLMAHETQICITNSEGMYVVVCPAKGGTLRVDFAGYESQEINMPGCHPIDFRLEPSETFHRSRKARIIHRRHFVAEHAQSR